jgi:hypothetical protein
MKRGPRERRGWLASVACAATLFPIGCATTPPPSATPVTQDVFQSQSPERRSIFPPGPSEPFGFDRLSAEVQWIPAMWITPDIDGDANPALEADLSPGMGVAARVGMGTRDQNIGLLFMGTEHDEQVTDRGSSVRTICLDFLYRGPVADTRNAIWFAVAAGVGGSQIEFDGSAFDTVTTGAALLRGELEFRVLDPMSISAGLGGFVLGHPGDTVAYGTFLELGLKVVF